MIPAVLQGVNAYTTRYITRKLEDLVYKGSPLLLRMRTRHRIDYDGGRQFILPFMYRRLPGGAYSRGQTVDISFVNTELGFQLNPKLYEVSVTLLGFDAVVNQGPQAILSQVEAKLANAAEAMAEYLAIDSYYSGLGIAAVGTRLGGQDTTPISLDGLAQWLDDGTTVPTVGGLSRADLATVGTVAEANAYVFGPIGTTSPNDIFTAIGKTWWGKAHVDLIVAEPNTWTFYHNKLQPNQRFYREDTDMVKAGFQSLTFMGADFVADNYSPAGMLWGMCSRFLKFWVSTNPLFRFGTTGFKEDQQTVGDVACQFAYAGDMAYSNPRTGYQGYGATS